MDDVLRQLLMVVFVPPPTRFPLTSRENALDLGRTPKTTISTEGSSLHSAMGSSLMGSPCGGIAGLGVLTWRASHVVLRNLTVEWTSQSALMLSNGRHDDPTVRDLTVEYCRVNQSHLGFWRDKENADRRKRGYEMRSETVSLIRWNGFHVHHNHISNSLMEGIDFKVGSRNGDIHHNIDLGAYQYGCETWRAGIIREDDPESRDRL
jgi:hypothetical protein